MESMYVPNIGKKEEIKVTGFFRKLRGSDLDTLFSALFNPGVANRVTKIRRAEIAIKPFLNILTSLKLDLPGRMKR
ncbi:MAG: hypothetical protein QXY96_06895, partial [Candidatus Methanomethylicaceae archaeon]